MCWPVAAQGPIVGLADGKVRAAHLKYKVSTLYNADSYTVSLVSNPEGTGFLSGHADGSIVRWYIADDPNSKGQGKVVTHPGSAPYAMSWTANHIVVAGSDKKIVFYSHDGSMFQQFDYFNDPTEKEFTVMSCSPSGQALCVGSFDRLRVYSWANRKNLWEENATKDIKFVIKT